MRSVESRAWLAGSGRSGTTWLGQVLAEPAGNALLYEPLRCWLERSPPVLSPPIFDAGDRPYFRVDAQVPSWRRYLESVLRGAHFTRRTLTAGRRPSDRPRALWRALIGRRLVVKEIRSNLMVGWLARTFDLRIVLLIRHPCATVASQASRGWGTRPRVLEVLLRQPELVHDYLSADFERLDAGVFATTLSRLAARWAIENRVALAMAAQDNRILPVAYEDLLVNPRPELQRIFEFLRWEPHRADWRRVLSRAGVERGGGTSRTMRLGRWKESLPPGAAAEILGVVRSFGIDFYDQNCLPTRPFAASPRDVATVESGDPAPSGGSA